MSRVQSIERAFAVLGALSDGPIGVTEVAQRVDLPKSTAARLLASLSREGAVEQVPGGFALPPRAADRPSRGGARSGRGSDRAGSPRARGARRGQRRGGRPVGARWLRRPLRRPGRHPEPGLDSRLDRHARPDARRVVRARLPRPPVARRAGAVPRPAAGAVHAGDARRAGGAARAHRRRPARRLRLGARRVRPGDHVGGGSDRRTVGEIVAAVHVHGPSYRFPVDGADATVSTAVVASAARISARLRQDAGSAA